MPLRVLERQMMLYTLLIAIITATTLSIVVLQSQGLILSKNAQLTMENSKAIENINDRLTKSQLGTTKSATYNLTLKNNEMLYELLNQTKLAQSPQP
jgi:uncharacterized membrane-anchored protein YitT (DUF2179 family)